MCYCRYLKFIFLLLCIGLFTTGCASSNDEPVFYYHSILLYNDTDYDLVIEYQVNSFDVIDLVGDLIGIYSLKPEDVDLRARGKINLSVASFDPTWGEYVVVYGDIRKDFEFADEFKTMHIHPMDLQE